MTFSRFECVLSVLLHEEPPITPQVLSFTNEMSRAKFTPLLEVDVKRGTGKFQSDASAFYDISDARLKQINETLKIADYMDNFIVGVGSGGIRVKRVIETSKEWDIVEWESGAKWRVGTAKNVWARQYLDYPVKTEDDINNLELPDPDDPSRYEGIEKAIKYVENRGFFPSCSINGFFSGVWYFLRGPLEIILKDAIVRRDFLKKVISKFGEFNLKAEKTCLKEEP